MESSSPAATRRPTTAIEADTRSTVEAFNVAWNRGDVAGVADLMAADAVYRASTGPGPGTVHVGRDAVRDAVAAVMAAEGETAPEAPLPPSEILVMGDRAVSTWQYSMTTAAGEVLVIEGVDVWTIRDGRIAVIDAYRKSFPDDA